jgi:hypothetical protein
MLHQDADPYLGTAVGLLLPDFGLDDRLRQLLGAGPGYAQFIDESDAGVAPLVFAMVLGGNQLLSVKQNAASATMGCGAARLSLSLIG